MQMVPKKRQLTLGAKLNILLITCILFISAGLLFISYRVYSRKVNSIYFKEAERAAQHASENFVPYQFIPHMRELIETDEFREVRARATEANDEEIIKNWMLEQPATAYQMEILETERENICDEDLWQFTLYGIYSIYSETLAAFKTTFDISSIYVQYVKDGVTYNLLDPDESLLIIGTDEEPIEAFSEYNDNVSIPATVYEFQGKMLCTACEPVYDDWAREMAVAQVCVDIDMSDVRAERHWFLMNSILFIAALTVSSIIISMLLVRKIVTKPLKLLAQGATGFGRETMHCTKDDVIKLPITSNDEIGDLYHEIQTMQERIVENTDRLTRITAERERVNTELHMATEIQCSMLPSLFPPFPDRLEFDLYASMKPAREVGGDFYDFFMVDDDHLALVIADVSDKGVPAALFMMSSRILINYRARLGGTPGEILAAVNNQILNSNTTKMFVTVWLGILTISTGDLICSNAGHEYPAIRNLKNKFRLFHDEHGFMIGGMPDMKYSNYKIRLKPGDAIFVYTDGLAESKNADDAFFGTDRIIEVLNTVADKNPREIIETIQENVNRFAGEEKQFDDITMMCIEYHGVPREEPKPDDPYTKSIRVSSDLEANHPVVMQFVKKVLDEINCPANVRKQLLVSVDEILTNISSYAYGIEQIGPVEVRVKTDASSSFVELTFIDNGTPFNPLAREDPDIYQDVDHRQIGGLGILLVKNTMDDLQYAYEDGHNILTIRKNLSEP